MPNSTNISLDIKRHSERKRLLSIMVFISLLLGCMAIPITSQQKEHDSAGPIINEPEKYDAEKNPSIPDKDLVPIIAENSQRIKQIGKWGQGIISTAVWSPKGDILALGGSIGIYFYDPDTGKRLKFIETKGWVESLSFSPDGGQMAYGLKDGSAWVWQSENDNILLLNQSYESLDKEGSKVAFTPDGELLAINGQEKILLFNASDYNLVGSIENYDPSGDLKISPDGKILATTDDFSEKIKLWIIPDGRLFRTLDQRAYDIEFSPDGSILASLTKEAITLWQVSDGSLLDIIKTDVQTIDMSFSPKDDIIAFNTVYTFVNIIQISDKSKTIIGGEANYWGFCRYFSFSPDGQNIALILDNSSVQVWEMKNNELIKTIADFTQPVVQVSYSPKGETIASVSNVSGLGYLNIWGFPDGKLILNKASGYNVRFSSDDKFIAISGIEIIEIKKSKTLYVINIPTKTNPEEFLYNWDFSPNGDIIAASSMIPGGDLNHSYIYLFQIPSGKLLNQLELPSNLGCHGLTISDYGNYLACGADNSVSIWDFPNCEIQRTIDITYAEDLIFTADNNLWVGDMYENVYLIKISSGEQILQIASRLVNIAYLPNSNILVGGLDDGSIQLFRGSDGALLATLLGHTESITDLDFSPDGRILTSGSDDGTIRFWGVAP